MILNNLEVFKKYFSSYSAAIEDIMRKNEKNQYTDLITNLIEQLNNLDSRNL